MLVKWYLLRIWNFNTFRLVWIALCNWLLQIVKKSRLRNLSQSDPSSIFRNKCVFLIGNMWVFFGKSCKNTASWNEHTENNLKSCSPLNGGWDCSSIKIRTQSCRRKSIFKHWNRSHRCNSDLNISAYANDDIIIKSVTKQGRRGEQENNSFALFLLYNMKRSRKTVRLLTTIIYYRPSSIISKFVN